MVTISAIEDSASKHITSYIYFLTANTSEKVKSINFQVQHTCTDVCICTDSMPLYM